MNSASGDKRKREPGIATHRLFTLGMEEGVVCVEAGELDLFVVAGQGESTRRRYFAFVPEGEWIFNMGFGSLRDDLDIPGCGQPGTLLREVSLEDAVLEELAARLDHWMQCILEAILRLSEGERDFTVLAQPGELLPLDVGNIVGVRQGVCWWQPSGGDISYLGVTSGEAAFLPLIPRLGVSIDKRRPVSRILSTREFLSLCDWRARLSITQQLLAKAIGAALSFREKGELLESVQRQSLREAAAEVAWEEIAEVLQSQSAFSVHYSVGAALPSIQRAFIRVAARMGMTLPPVNMPDKGETSLETVAGLARSASIRWRQVLLSGRWFSRNNGPMIGFLTGSNEAVALIPSGSRRYSIIYPNGSIESVTRTSVEKLLPSAISLYRTLPDRKLRLLDIVKFSVVGNLPDFSMVFTMIVITGLLGLVVPALSARIYDVIIPQSERGLMVQIAIVLASAAIVNGAFQLVRSIALLRIENRVDGQLQAAVWDRLLKLPTGFFRKYTAGDLATRAQGITEAREVLSSAGTTVLFALPSGLFNLIVMFCYSFPLACWGLGIAVLGTLMSVGFSVAEILILRKQYAILGKLTGLTFQLINGVGKFRMANAESFAFGVWARDYAAKEKLAVKAGKWSVASQTFFSGFSLLTTAVIFGLVAQELAKTATKGSAPAITTGTFLAFNSAFGALIGSLVVVAQSALNLLQLFPLLERTKPIFEAEPEVSVSRTHPGELLGEIEISNVRFSYHEDVPCVLDGFSLKIKAGEMVALVGPSGCGKSTLLRLLLGFEAPGSGSIFYDGKDLQTLDLREVRRQIGVVLQATQLITGDIFRNIVGESNLTHEEAWEAAAMAGLADDIRAMPMQMYTVISEGGGGFSGGQKQRLAIARAFVHKPRVLFFDEATSSLDNRTQATVTQSLERMQVTRVIIAHRLSTIRKADRIVVLCGGQVCEEGTYEALMEQKGTFHELAQRQLA